MKQIKIGYSYRLELPQIKAETADVIIGTHDKPPIYSESVPALNGIQHDILLTADGIDGYYIMIVSVNSEIKFTDSVQVINPFVQQRDVQLKKLIAELDAVIQARINSDTQQLSMMNKSLTKEPLDTLVRLREKYQDELNKYNNAKNKQFFAGRILLR